MKIIALNQFFGEADPTTPVYVNAEDVSYIEPGLNLANTVITFNNGHTVDVLEDSNYVLAKWREATRG